MNRKYWGFVKFSLLLAVKSFPRVFVAPYVGAVRGILKEKDRIDAQIDDYIAREFKEN